MQNIKAIDCGEDEDSKWPRLLDSSSPPIGPVLANDLDYPKLLINCRGWRWICRRDILAERCAFFGVCSEGGYLEAKSREINLDDDEPRALQTMLRYLYTLDCANIFRHDDPLFSDIERDLDVFAIADKYDLQLLKKYMQDNLVLFYSTDKNPPLDPKGWSPKNQSGFGKVLTKLCQFEIDTSDIKKAVTGFIARGGQKVMSWPGVQDAVEEDGRLSHDLIVASFAAKRAADGRSRMLEREVEDLNEQLSELLDENEELHGEVEHLAGLVNGYDSADYDDWPLYDNGDRGSDVGCYYYDFDDDPYYLARFWDQI